MAVQKSTQIVVWKRITQNKTNEKSSKGAADARIIRKSLERHTNNYWKHVAILAQFYGRFVEKIWQQTPYNYSASFWTNNFSIWLWGRLKAPHFHDLEIFGRAHDSQNQYYLSLEAPEYLK